VQIINVQLYTVELKLKYINGGAGYNMYQTCLNKNDYHFFKSIILYDL